ncbi:hypothetical protein E3P81_02272 [Wallemia ichthyophaga]|nr:hypothetical protein E3P97_02271 [Wallemia ichthyophaga]TIB32025.1 hypothetical protein E3P85_01993 [Wallemia ichthyophaga]TIB46282.1 hypothetical protein E3P82_02269 [Wallemia ichthyophaga]TIB50093.1 hypothetical protein E3P81_02272 [Wallemia ichthyophaga]TIB53125.1 hypothetical protein E3P80_02270 [Wallemia ichthyophaga]
MGGGDTKDVKDTKPNYLNGLNAAQCQAVLHEPYSSLQILAGPGSGKTRVLTTRIAHMILEHNILPSNIVAVTFTNKAAKEMKERLKKLIDPKKVEGLIMGTFHSVCIRYIKIYGKFLDPPMTKDWSIIDASDSKDVVAQVCKEDSGLKGLADYSRNKISWYKAKRIGPDDLEDIAEATTDKFEKKQLKQVAYVYEEYQKKLDKFNCLDFDDLLIEGCRVFEQVPNAKSNIRVMLVDEFQDTNTVQYDLMRLMSRNDYVSIVGDPDQSIYGWRAAEIGNLQKMKKDFQNTSEIYLEQTYRSSGAIVKAAMSVMSQDKTRPEKELKTDHPEGSPVTLKEFFDGDSEAYWIAKEIKRQIAYSGNKLRYEDFVILLRFNALSRTIESQLNKMRIPVRVLAGTKFFDRSEIKDIMSYLTLLINPSHTPALKRSINVPKRGMGPKSVEDIVDISSKAILPPFTMLLDGLINEEKVKGWKASWKKLDAFVYPLDESRQALRNGKPLKSIVEKLIADIEYESYLKVSCSSEREVNSRVENLKELLSFAATIDDDFNQGTLFKPDEEFDSVKDQNFARLGKFLEVSSLDVSFNTEADVDEALGKVTISTIHSAKGLEWPVVFMPAVESGVIPFFKADTEDQVREERRLLYVGMTRAQAVLNISHARSRLVAGSMKDRCLSDFLKFARNLECYQDDIMLIDDKLRSQLLSIVNLDYPNKEDLKAAINEFEEAFKVDKLREQQMKQNERLRNIDGEGNDYNGYHEYDPDGYDRYDYRSRYGRGKGYNNSYQRFRAPKSNNLVQQLSHETLNNPFKTGSGGSIASGGAGGSNRTATTRRKVHSDIKPFNPPRPAVPPAPASKEVKAEVEASGNSMKRYKTDPDVEILDKAASHFRSTNLQSFQQGADKWKDSLKGLLPDSGIDGSGDSGDAKPLKKPRT